MSVAPDNIRLDRYLRRLYPGLQQGLIEKLLRLGKIRVNGEKALASRRLLPTDELTVPKEVTDVSLTSKPTNQTYNPKDADFIESLILWEDEDLCVLNKPFGIAVQGGTKTRPHLDGMLKSYSQYIKSREPLRLVHRLDRDTSGVWIVAKTAKMAAHLAEQFKENKVEKIYWALVHGVPPLQTDTIKAPLLKQGIKDLEKMVVDFKEGKSAVTDYRIIKKLNPHQTWVECRPKTGRTHQIRVHMESIGTPIVGDVKYGAADDESVSLCLHARQIRIRDLDGNVLTFTAPPPNHMVNLLKLNKINWEGHA